MTMTAIELDAYRANVARDVLNISSISLLEKIKKLIKREEKESNVMTTDNYIPLTHEELVSEFKESLDELKLNLEGKMEFRPIEELINEL